MEKYRYEPATVQEQQEWVRREKEMLAKLCADCPRKKLYADVVMTRPEGEEVIRLGSEFFCLFSRRQKCKKEIREQLMAELGAEKEEEKLLQIRVRRKLEELYPKPGWHEGRERNNGKRRFPLPPTGLANEPCEQCGATKDVHWEDSRTQYSWDGMGENPNRPRALCPECAKYHHKYWDERWDEYRNGVL